MQMKPEDFEKRLQRQVIRTIPPEWREEIVGRLCESATDSSPSRALPPRGGLHSWLRELLWPSPIAWGTLAAVWLVVLGLHLIAPGVAQRVASQPPPASPSKTLLTGEEEPSLMVGRAEQVSAPTSVPPSAPQRRGETGWNLGLA